MKQYPSKTCPCCMTVTIPTTMQVCLGCYASAATGADLHCAITMRTRPHILYHSRRLHILKATDPSWLPNIDGSFIKKDTIIKVCEQVELERKLHDHAADKMYSQWGTKSGITGGEFSRKIGLRDIHRIKARVMAAYSHCCLYCNEPTKDVAVDCILPAPFDHSRGAGERQVALYFENMELMSNLAAVCHKCNHFKGQAENRGSRMLRDLYRGVGLIKYPNKDADSFIEGLTMPRRSLITSLHDPSSPVAGVTQGRDALSSDDQRWLLWPLLLRLRLICMCDRGCTSYKVYYCPTSRTLTISCRAAQRPEMGLYIAEIFWPASYWRNKWLGENNAGKKKNEEKQLTTPDHNA